MRNRTGCPTADVTGNWICIDAPAILPDGLHACAIHTKRFASEARPVVRRSPASKAPDAWLLCMLLRPGLRGRNAGLTSGAARCGRMHVPWSNLSGPEPSLQGVGADRPGRAVLKIIHGFKGRRVACRLVGNRASRPSNKEAPDARQHVRLHGAGAAARA